LNRVADPFTYTCQESGLTLVEMLVVLAIIGISTGTAVLAMTANHDDGGKVEAQRLLTRVQLAADEAMISDRALALAVTPTSYAVLDRGDAGRSWQPTTLGGLDDVHELPRGMHLSTLNDRKLLPLDADAGRLFEITLDRGSQHWTVSFDGMRAHLAAGGAEARSASSS
jgi:type II secretion system protein H